MCYESDIINADSIVTVMSQCCYDVAVAAAAARRRRRRSVADGEWFKLDKFNDLIHSTDAVDRLQADDYNKTGKHGVLEKKAEGMSRRISFISN